MLTLLISLFISFGPLTDIDTQNLSFEEQEALENYESLSVEEQENLFIIIEDETIY